MFVCEKRKQNQRLGIFTLVLIMPKTIVCVNCKYKDRVEEREKDKEKMCAYVMKKGEELEIAV